jgi:glycerol-3-phosphate acyltransferase PlsY
MNVLPPPVLSALAIALSYLLGSTPWGLVLVRVFKGVDVRSVGSGNIGATNAMRAGGRGLGLAVFALDFVRGWAAVGGCAARLTRLGADRVRRGGGGRTLLPAVARIQGRQGVSTLCGVAVARIGACLCGGAVWLIVLRGDALRRPRVVRDVPVAAVATWWLQREAGFWLTVRLAALALLMPRAIVRTWRACCEVEPKIWQKRAGGSEQRG